MIHDYRIQDSTAYSKRLQTEVLRWISYKLCKSSPKSVDKNFITLHLFPMHAEHISFKCFRHRHFLVFFHWKIITHDFNILKSWSLQEAECSEPLWEDESADSNDIKCPDFFPAALEEIRF